MIGLRRRLGSRSIRKLFTGDTPHHIHELVGGVLRASEELRRLTENPGEVLQDVAGDAPDAVQDRRESLRPAQVKLREELERARRALSKDVEPGQRREIEKVVDRVAGSAQALLGPDWARLADGRTYRVRTGRDFHLTIPQFAQAAQQAATLTGKRVLLVKDKKDIEKYTWVQFLDGEITLGEPCKCGGLSLIRIRGHIVRCQACQSTLLATPPPDPNAPPKGKKGRPPPPTPLDPERTLTSFTEARLRLVDTGVDEWRYSGYATPPSGETAFVTIRVPIVEGSPVPDGSSQLGWAHEIIEERPAGGADDAGPWDVVF